MIRIHSICLEKQGSWLKSKTHDNCKHHLISNLGGGVQFIDSDNNYVVLLDRLKGLRKFYFDHVIPGKFSNNIYMKSLRWALFLILLIASIQKFLFMDKQVL